nr:MAG TPA: adenine specific DNA methyltransferase [Caudoviricetes sp.]
MNDRMSDQHFLFFLHDTFHALKTALKPTAPMYIFHASKTQREFQNAMEENGIEIISQLIWNKPSINHIGAAYKSKHEPFFYARMKDADIPRYGSEIYEETVRTLPTRAEKSDKEILQMIKKVKEAEKEGLTTIRTQKRHPVQDYEHPTQKPVELVERAILNSSRE